MPPSWDGSVPHASIFPRKGTDLSQRFAAQTLRALRVGQIGGILVGMDVEWPWWRKAREHVRSSPALTVRGLADILGVQRKSLTRWLSGEISPTRELDVVRRLAGIFGWGLAYFTDESMGYPPPDVDAETQDIISALPDHARECVSLVFRDPRFAEAVLAFYRTYHGARDDGTRGRGRGQRGGHRAG